MVKIKKNTRPDWAIKKPRSSRICFRCQHKYSSHVPLCGKIVERKPERKECDCRTFVKNQYELDLALKKEIREECDRVEARKNMEKYAFKEKTLTIR
ncbi:hypothetical protein LCGC14_1220550 [marine sediment metagenome]|uniref:Uncharacterized protein n=1 Tax=marine sediment metagenome TaxID=412755 RepID=A0A0F9LFD9_9ZZZZ